MLRLKLNSIPKPAPRREPLSARTDAKQSNGSRIRPACKSHPLACTKLLTIEMEFDNDAGSFVTYVKKLHGMSTYGETELEALENTAEMIRGHIKSMEANGKKIPLSSRKLNELKQIVGVRQMSKFPVVNGKKAVAALERPGFRLDRVEGSHRIMIKDGHRWTVPVPVHGSRSILKGTLRSIIRMAGVTKKQFYAHVR